MTAPVHAGLLLQVLTNISHCMLLQCLKPPSPCNPTVLLLQQPLPPLGCAATPRADCCWLQCALFGALQVQVPARCLCCCLGKVATIPLPLAWLALLAAAAVRPARLTAIAVSVCMAAAHICMAAADTRVCSACTVPCMMPCTAASHCHTSCCTALQHTAAPLPSTRQGRVRRARLASAHALQLPGSPAALPTAHVLCLGCVP